MTKPFVFKDFTVHQDRCAMKIGTDGVLLAAWAPINDTVTSILDIGAGTGIIALMAAQRSQAEVIDAIEIDVDAYEQAVENFEASPWGDRLFCYHASFQEFVSEIDDQYDLLISNPPFYAEDYKTSDIKRDMARFEDALPFEHLLIGASKLLSDKGKFAMIIPYKEETRAIDIAAQVNLFPQKITRVKGTPVSEIKRSLLLFGRDQMNFEANELVIETKRHHYTDEYINLTKAFYLKM
ncbi:tRNA1Val (adenine37-N6)-methyltransferase [Aquimarina sp. EL_43]|uniref:tRNA1(Val) (adenine(37)-N6)-methyltransferase n=1 Tax=unclassified Aquimarina TaxID=2627091 RepID=UPI0018CA0305|nr:MULTISPECIES: methyltransferase [unclassified Aquimarina]MBG6130479.1 tRNA1Val (adenine37-N6)-methyltransferase [Aquimarina sp. EL_35]MBG6149259.1 tRNA1Val (adenine37-N6)-methyltransferase [Aquimarina sp. EL_32]MBG6168367.1 tRNA1Val (adenine37-N6)-methyltransferase [Aquimarina sp. EL_43]